MPDAGDASVAAAKWLDALAYRPERPEEALALAVHALLLRHGLRTRQTALETDMNRDPLPQAPAERPEDWLPTAERAGYGTQYRHFRSALMFQIRSVPSGPDRLVVTGFAIEEPERVGTLSLRISDYIRAHVWEQAQTTTTTPLDWSALVQGWQRLATLVQVDLVHTLIPDSAKDGYEPRASPLSGTNTGSVHNGGSAGVDAQGPRSSRDPFAGPSRGWQPAPHPTGPVPAVGDDDRLPVVGPGRDWHRPSPPGLMPPFHHDDERLGGGMLVGPNHPLFRIGSGDDLDDPDRDLVPPDPLLRGQRALRRADRERLAQLPPGSRVPPPPGARIDPFGPTLPPPDGQPNIQRNRHRYGDLDPPPPDTMYM